MPIRRFRSVPCPVMRKYTLVALALVTAVLLAGCGSSGSKAGSNTTPPTTTVNQLSSPLWDKAGPTPSKSAQDGLLRRKRAKTSRPALGVKETSVTTPTWNKAQHLYSCTYVYPNGQDHAVGEGDVERGRDHGLLRQRQEEVRHDPRAQRPRAGRVDPQEQRRRRAQGLQGAARRRARDPGELRARR